MNLATNWSEVSSSEHLYDEYEEYDELDESEDGCGGVVWQQYVLNKSRTSSKMLHELARDVGSHPQRYCSFLRSCSYWQAFVGNFKRWLLTCLSCWSKHRLRNFSKSHSKQSLIGLAL